MTQAQEVTGRIAELEHATSDLDPTLFAQVAELTFLRMEQAALTSSADDAHLSGAAPHVSVTTAMRLLHIDRFFGEREKSVNIMFSSLMAWGARSDVISGGSRILAYGKHGDNFALDPLAKNGMVGLVYY